MNKEGKILLAKIRCAERAERYDDMTRFLNQFVKSDSLDGKDSTILASLGVAYKNAVGERRAAWRNILSLHEEQATSEKGQDEQEGGQERLEGEKNTHEENKERLEGEHNKNEENRERQEGENETDEKRDQQGREDEDADKDDTEDNDTLDKKDVTRLYLYSIGEEIINYCNQLLDLITDYLIPAYGNTDHEILLLKMKGDYFRYMAEVQNHEERMGSVESSDEAYTEAAKKADFRLRPCDQIKLELALNHSVLKFDLKDDPEEACTIARKAFEEALEAVNKEDGERYMKTAATMQIIRDNLVQWTLASSYHEAV